MLLDLLVRTCRETTVCFAECGIFICHNAMLERSPSSAWSGTCGVGALEAELAVALRGGPLSTQTFTTGELPSDQSGANHTLMKS